MEPNNKIDVPVAGEVSETVEDLNAKIDAELGLEPQAPVKTEEPAADEVTTPPPADEPSTDEPDSPPDTDTPQPDADDTKEEPDDTPEDKPETTPTDSDLFIEVEDAEGLVHKITKIEDLPEDFEPKNNRQIIEIVAKLGKLDTEREASETKAAEDARQAEETKAQQERFKSWDNEVEALAKDKRIDMKDQERIDSVFAHMNKINAERVKNGNPNMILSFEDALDKLEVTEAKQAAEDAKKAETDTAKRKAGLIGRSSTAVGDNYRYVAGSARSIDDIPM